MKNNITKKRLLLPVFIISFFLILCFFLFGKSDSLRFQKLTGEIFKSELTQDTLSMHYILANPQDYGIRGYTPCLPIYSKAGQEQGYIQLQKNLDALHSIHPSRLDQDSARVYALLISYLEQEKKEQEFPYYQEPLSPSSGVQSQLPILLAEYSFRSIQDVDDYLAVLSQTEAYFESLLTYEKEKAGAGLFMPDYSADKIAEQCSSIMQPSDIQSEKHFLNTTFEERLDGLVKNGIISSEQKAAYLKENSRILLQTVLPAYKKLGSGILSLKGQGKNLKGLCHYPQGRDYYRHLLRRTTGSQRTINDVKKLLCRQFATDCAQLSRLLEEQPGLLDGDSSAFPLTNPEDMLSHLQNVMQESFPQFPAPDSAAPAHTIKKVSPSLENYTSPAFYLTPPLDDISENSIYINYKNNPEGLGLYTTLAHEGYPGHLYQTVYYQLYQQKNEGNPVRSLLHYGGYIEGWALYVEMLSYDYAGRLALENRLPAETAMCYDVERLDRSLQLCLYSLLDLAIHYDGADYQTVHTLLSQFGITNPKITENIYQYIVEEPVTYLKYYLGYLEILSLKEDAKETWGEAYTDKRFHQFLLEAGPCPFDMLKIKKEYTLLKAALSVQDGFSICLHSFLLNTDSHC